MLAIGPISINFRPAAIPLFTTDPFMQTWMRGDNATAASVTHWAGELEKQMVGLVRIDSQPYGFLGKHSEVLELHTTSVSVLPTRTVFTLELPGVVALNLTFLQTLFTDDYTRLSRPVYYALTEFTSIDGAAHEVSVYLDASAQHAVNKVSTSVGWDGWARDGLVGVQLGAAEQHVLGSKGDRVNIDWGYLHLAVPSSPYHGAVWAGSAASARAAFTKTGVLPSAPDSRYPRLASDDLPALAAMQSATVPAGGAVAITTLMGYDETRAIYYFGAEYKGAWTQAYKDIQAASAPATSNSGNGQ